MSTTQNAIFQQDDARDYTAVTTRQALQGIQIPTMHWSAQSLDLSPKEHAWDAIHRRIRSPFHAAETVEQLTV